MLSRPIAVSRRVYRLFDRAGRAGQVKACVCKNLLTSISLALHVHSHKAVAQVNVFENSTRSAPARLENDTHPLGATHLKTGAARQTQRDCLNHYFETQNFDFGSHDRDSSLGYLKRCMEMVYLRELPLICIDIEAYERNPKMITEVGVAIYDPRGSLGESIVPEIRTAHLMVSKHLHVRNKRFVPDRKSLHMGGTSHIMSEEEISKFFTLIFEKYLGDSGCLVGHQLGGDLKWLAMIGVEVPPLVSTVDTLSLHKLTRVNKGLLRALLRSLNIPHAYLHNAANDAYYTMLVALSLCDPHVRKRYDLDAYKVSTNEVQTAFMKRKEKFSDQADFINSDGHAVFASLEDI